MKKTHALIGFFAHFSVILFILFLAIRIPCFSERFYAEQYAKLGTAESIGISEEDLVKSTKKLLSYTEGKAEDLELEVKLSESGKENTLQMFNPKEKRHMEDVRDLYLGFRKLIFILAIFVLAFLIYSAIRLKRTDAKSRSEVWKGYKRGFVFSSISFIFLLIFLAIYASADFYSFWTNFHKVFFRNDLWLLDPDKDRLIQMVPGPFFSALVMRILLIFSAGTAVFCAGSIYTSHVQVKKLKKSIE